jgi:hypothetical protein
MYSHPYASLIQCTHPPSDPPLQYRSSLKLLHGNFLTVVRITTLYAHLYNPFRAAHDQLTPILLRKEGAILSGAKERG